MTQSTLLAAQLLLRDGMSIIPVARAKKPAIAWASYMLHRADDQTVQQWYSSSSSHGIGIVCGHVSG